MWQRFLIEMVREAAEVIRDEWREARDDGDIRYALQLRLVKLLGERDEWELKLANRAGWSTKEERRGYRRADRALRRTERRIRRTRMWLRRFR